VVTEIFAIPKLKTLVIAAGETNHNDIALFHIFGLMPLLIEKRNRVNEMTFPGLSAPCYIYDRKSPCRGTYMEWFTTD